MDLRGVQKREPHPSIFALGGEMRDKLWGSKNYLVRHQILVLQVVKGPLFFYGQNIPIPIQETVVKRVNALVAPNGLRELILTAHAHTLDTLVGYTCGFRYG